MNVSTLIAYLQNPSLLKSADTRDLEELVKQYPYFQTAQILLAKKYKLENHPDFEKQLGRAATAAVDRARLFNIMEMPVSAFDELQEEEFLRSNDSGGNAEFTPSVNFFEEEEDNDLLILEEDPEISSAYTMEEEFILRDLDFEFKEREIEKISVMESPLLLEAENTDAETIP